MSAHDPEPLTFEPPDEADGPPANVAVMSQPAADSLSRWRWRGFWLMWSIVAVILLIILGMLIALRIRPSESLPAAQRLVGMAQTIAAQPIRVLQLPSMTSPLPTDSPTQTPTPAAPFVSEPFQVGASVQGRPLLAYRLGHGPLKRALIGGIHGGYEWNTVELMSRTLEHLSANPDLLPRDLTLYIIPVLNPDGLAAGTDRIHGRLNANLVDLNRNWDYQWQMTATHGVWPVFAGRFPFSEPEAVAARDFITSYQIDAVIFYHSALAKVFQGAGITTSKTVQLAQSIAQATGYRYSPEGVVGQVTTGDAIDWLTANGITAIEIELTTHADIDWEQNLQGLITFLNWDLPLSTPPPGDAGPAGQRIHIVQEGDTLLGITLQYSVSLEALLQTNLLNPEDILSIGQRIIIP